MITLPAPLEKVMQSQDLKGLKPFAMLFRNKWDSVNNKFALDTLNPIDISDMIVKPNTLSMTLDVSEIAQYNANNITLTLTDKDNRFIEGTPNSFFPAGYQLYGSQVVLYYGLDDTNKTSLFVGVIKDLPTHKPEQYQVDLKLVSPLEMLNDIEAKEFSDKYTGETLSYVKDDEDGHKVYETSGVGVGGFSAVYANGTKLFEGIDYEVNQLSVLGSPANVIIIKSDYYSATITADYFTWKTNLPIEDIIAGLVALAGYDSATEDIRNVVWTSAVRGVEDTNLLAAIGYTKSGTTYTSVDGFNGGVFAANQNYDRHNYFPQDFKITISAYLNNLAGFNSQDSARTYYFGSYNNGADTGVALVFEGPYTASGQNGIIRVIAYKYTNGSYSGQTIITNVSGRNNNPNTTVRIEKNGTSVAVIGETTTANYTFTSGFDFGNSQEYNDFVRMKKSPMTFTNYKMELYSDSTAYIENKGIIFENSTGTERTWSTVLGYLSDDTSQYNAKYRVALNGSFEPWQAYQLNSDIGITTDSIQVIIQLTTGNASIENLLLQYLSSSISFALVNLTGKSVLEAIQDLALISGYEFGVNREGTLFFRPRLQSTTPIFELDETQIIKIENIKQNFNDFFTKLTLTFAEIPLEFYANSGARPTPIDRYGVINKEIDKPDIVNYDNPELAQAIGPQLLEVYSNLSDVIQCTAKLNLSLELGDIVNLKRNYNLNTADSATDYTKWENQNTYYRACKITGINYNLSKRQMTYTLRDVSNSNNQPIYVGPEFVYDLPIEL